MYVSAKERVGPWKSVMVVDRASAKAVGTAYTADTAEGWYEMYLVDPETDRVMLTDWKPQPDGSLNREFITAKVTLPFDIVDRETGIVLAES